jgi:hypothetical protein
MMMQLDLYLLLLLLPLPLPLPLLPTITRCSGTLSCHCKTNFAI